MKLKKTIFTLMIITQKVPKNPYFKNRTNNSK